MMDTMALNNLTLGQRQALNELREVSAADPAALEIVAVNPVTVWGWLPIEISLATAGAGRVAGASISTGPRAKVRARERFIIYVPEHFPFVPPNIWVSHERFADLPHVQWRRYLCLYLSPTTEWQPSDGMFGLLERLLIWIEHAAAGALDPVGEALHPPVAYPSQAGGTAVIRANTPHVENSPWIGYAVFTKTTTARVDLVGWLADSDAERLLAAPSVELLEELTGIPVKNVPFHLGLAVLLAEPIAFEYPTQARDLIDMLSTRGVSKQQILDGFAQVTHLNHHVSNTFPALQQALYVVIGSPARGIAGGALQQHLAIWRLPSGMQHIVDMLDHLYSQVEEVVLVATQVRELVNQWLDTAVLDWVQLYEDRSEVTTRRDQGSPLEWIRGKTVLIIGCGALGGHLAEHLVRAGVAKLVLVDHGKVSPGILVRQPYVDAHIGQWKAQALCEHLQRIRNDLEVEVKISDALQVVFDEATWPPEVDLIVDAAANLAVTAALERQRRGQADNTPPLLSLLLGHTAGRGIATIAPQGHSGGGVDLLRKVKLATLAEQVLRPFADDFFPEPPRASYFQPEPGCSEPTFVGSNAEVSALTATLLLHALAAFTPQPASPVLGHAVLIDLGMDHTPAIIRRLSWPSDIVVRDCADGLDVRIATTAVAEMRAECCLMARRRGQEVETGGLLFGEIDDACGVAWVSLASGPPPDSRASDHVFVCGTEGVEALVHQQETLTRGAKRFLGLWHSHPGGQAATSTIDEKGMQELLMPVVQAPRRALLLIIGAAPARWMAWLGTPNGEAWVLPDFYTRLCHRTQRAGGNAAATGKAYTQALASVDAGETRRWPRAKIRSTIRPRWWLIWRRWYGGT